MTRAESFVLVVSNLEKIQQMSGRPIPVITGLTRPLDDLEGFESINSVELAALLGEFFHIDLKLNICWSKEEKRSLSVNEIVDLLLPMEIKP